MKEELIDVLDENGIKTGKNLSRKEVHKKELLVNRDECYESLSEYLFRI